MFPTFSKSLRGVVTNNFPVRRISPSGYQAVTQWAPNKEIGIEHWSKKKKIHYWWECPATPPLQNPSATAVVSYHLDLLQVSLVRTSNDLSQSNSAHKHPSVTSSKNRELTMLRAWRRLSTFLDKRKDGSRDFETVKDVTDEFVGNIRSAMASEDDLQGITIEICLPERAVSRKNLCLGNWFLMKSLTTVQWKGSKPMFTV